MAQTITPIQLQSASTLLIAIDFGTTFTGVAFAYSRGETIQDPKRAVDSITVIKEWPNYNRSHAQKTPTVLSYHSSPPSWGASVKPHHEPKISHFKLGLEANASSHYGYRTSSNPFMMQLKHPRFRFKTAVDFTAEYLDCVFKWVHETYFPEKFGADFLESQQLSYVITVPAIWRDAAKDLTRVAAKRAGVPSDRMVLITEPEAAALYCATLCNEVDLRVGNHFVVCDAGGGTVDLTSYTILSHGPFHIEECTLGTGAVAGATKLDDGFEALLRRKLGRKADKILTKETLPNIHLHFDRGIKRDFNPYEDTEQEFPIPFPGVPDAPEADLEDGYMILKRDELNTIFTDIFDQIFSLIDDQLKHVKRSSGGPARTVFLVGGLGSNVYLGQFLRKKLRYLDIYQPQYGVSAVMRGAVLHSLGLNVKERVMRRSYGVIQMPLFVRGTHPQELMFRDYSGEVRCRDVMKWYVVKGAKVQTGTTVIESFEVNYRWGRYRAGGSLPFSVTLYSCEEEAPPGYLDYTVTPLCTVQVDLRKLPPRAFQVREGQNGKYYRGMYQLGLVFGPELVFKFMFNGQVYGTAMARYF